MEGVISGVGMEGVISGVGMEGIISGGWNRGDYFRRLE